MKVVYQSSLYDAALVTGRYVRCMGKRGAYTFRVFEAGDGVGIFKGKPGHGPTLREYDVSGSELPKELRDRCIASKATEKWD